MAIMIKRKEVNGGDILLFNSNSNTYAPIFSFPSHFKNQLTSHSFYLIISR
jgi:hypothetical protein